jgi:ABC-type nitrate/sulfonate/bicarbonate transport system permease component
MDFASCGAGRGEVLWTVVSPGIRSHVLTRLRSAVGLAWLILVPAEMLGADSGLGYFVLNTRDRLAYGDLMVPSWWLVPAASWLTALPAGRSASAAAGRRPRRCQEARWRQMMRRS